jgi:hypothetical protein
MEEISIEDIQNYMRGKDNSPIIHVKDRDDPVFKTMQGVVKNIWPETGDSIWEVAQHWHKLMVNLRYMEPRDYNSVVATFKKYEVSGEVRPISGTKSYGFDRSRLDSKMYKRKRGN